MYPIAVYSVKLHLQLSVGKPIAKCQIKFEVLYLFVLHSKREVTFEERCWCLVYSLCDLFQQGETGKHLVHHVKAGVFLEHFQHMICCKRKEIQVHIFQLRTQVGRRFIFQSREDNVYECVVFLNESEAEVFEFYGPYLGVTFHRIQLVSCYFSLFFELLLRLTSFLNDLGFFQKFLKLVIWVHDVRILYFRFLLPSLFLPYLLATSLVHQT